MVINRFDIYLVSLGPTRGSEIKKTRPCVVVSPDEMNHNIKTIIIAPLTTSIKKYPTRIPVEFKGKKGQIVLDQIKTVDKTRLIRRIGRLKKSTYEKVVSALHEMFEI